MALVCFITVSAWQWDPTQPPQPNVQTSLTSNLIPQQSLFHILTNKALNTLPKQKLANSMARENSKSHGNIFDWRSHFPTWKSISLRNLQPTRSRQMDYPRVSFCPPEISQDCLQKGGKTITTTLSLSANSALIVRELPTAMAVDSGTASNTSVTRKKGRVQSPQKVQSQYQENAVPSPAKRNKSPGIRVLGGRIYDPVNGKTCHQVCLCINPFCCSMTWEF